MGDIMCPTCGEPYDSYHLHHDAVWETDLPEYAAKYYSESGCKPFSKEVRTALEQVGWSFPPGATSVLCFIRCPSCAHREEEHADEDEIAKRQVLMEILGDDEDAIQSELEDGFF